MGSQGTGRCLCYWVYIALFLGQHLLICHPWAGFLGVAADSQYPGLSHTPLPQIGGLKAGGALLKASVTVSALSTVPSQFQGLPADPECLTTISKKLLPPGLTPTSLITCSHTLKVRWLWRLKPPRAREVVGKMEKNSQEREKA